MTCMLTHSTEPPKPNLGRQTEVQQHHTQS